MMASAGKRFSRLKRRAKRLKRQIWAIYLALKDPRTPWPARIIIGCTIAYAASPIDLIPDFIPVLGQLDDLVIVPALIALALRFIPPEVSAKCRREAWRHAKAGERVHTAGGTIAAIVFVLTWAGLLVLIFT